MALPTSRDFDATDAGPLNHTVTNAIQDAIVGRQHGEIIAHLPATAFVNFSGATLSGEQRWDLTSGDRVVAPLSHILVEDSVLTEFTVYYEGDATLTVEFRVDSNDLISNTVLTPVTGKSTAASAGFQTLAFTSADAGIPLTVATATQYFMVGSAAVAAGTVGLLGVQMKFTKPT